jgi:hypothetical protein
MRILLIPVSRFDRTPSLAGRILHDSPCFTHDIPFECGASIQDRSGQRESLPLELEQVVFPDDHCPSCGCVDRPVARQTDTFIVNSAAGIPAPSGAVTSQSFLATVSVILTHAEVVIFRLSGMSRAHIWWVMFQPVKSGTGMMLSRPSVASSGVEPLRLKRKWSRARPEFLRWAKSSTVTSP